MPPVSTIYSIQIPYLINSERQSWNSHCARTTRYWLRTFSYVGPHLWNSVSNDHSDIAHIDFNEFRAFLNTWKGPDISRYAIPLLWWLQCCEWFLCWCLSCIGYLYWYFYCKFTCIFLSYDMIVYLAIALYIFAPYTCSRILAFG